MQKRYGLVFVAMMSTTTIASAGFLPAIVSQGSKLDQGTSELAYAGARRFSQETGDRYLEIQVANDAQKVQALRAMANRKADMVIAIGFTFAPAMEVVAREFPRVKFVMVDTLAKGRNVESIQFREHEGSFLVGMAAALKSQTHRIGFIGGMDVPLIRAFGCGYAQGARYVDRSVHLVQNMVGTTSAAFYDPGRGAELARSHFDQGVDVIYAAAGPTSNGVLQQAKASGKLAIGVDINQNGLYPGAVLTSMVKRVDNAVYLAMKSGRDGSWRPGVKSLGLKEDGVDWALDAHNRALITPAMERRIDAARAAIADGRLKVADYRRDNHCPVS